MTEQPPPAAPAGTVCPSCGADLASGVRFCESCGAQVGDAAAAPPAMAPADGSSDPLGDAPISAPTRRPVDALPDPVQGSGRRPCANCGGEVGPDLYCLQCGTKAPSERDHFEEDPATWVSGVCDKGVTKARNEDAMALLAGANPGSRAVLIVLDGVSSSTDSDVASLAGAHAAREVLRTPLPAGMGTPQSRDAAVAKVFADAVAAANTAIIAVTDPDSPNPASATFTCAVLEDGRISHANVGDSRCYWVPDDGEAVALTLDDSVAEQQIASGIDRETAEHSEQAHAITKWLGRDAQDIVPSVGSLDVTGPGWVMACSDGLWNYASDAGAMKAQVQAAGPVQPHDLARHLLDFANASGGHDNITVALARVGDLPPAAAAAPPPPPPPPPPPAAPPSPPPVQNAGGPTAPPAPTEAPAGEGAPTDG
ncbi:protein phosphatase 2C domain-containing protein [Nocardioides sp. MH1]|uniref:protein phosphatase 2C domain-containing protein n=1 Tax=Nocardioides sp. MH1 TaxID=3242490 RepID=UPI003522C71A